MHRITLLACASALTLAGCTSDPLRIQSDHRLTRSLDQSHSDQPSNPRPSSRYRDHDAPSSSIQHTDPETANEYIRAALYRSPELESAYQEWVAISNRVAQAGALPDPRLTVGFFANEVETRVGAQQASVGISQQFPWSGKLRASEEAAAAEARAAWVRYIATERSITRRVVAALYALYEMDETIRITNENLALLSSFEDSIRSRFRVGVGSHPDLVRTQVELGLLSDQLVSLQSARTPLVAQLNALLDRPHDTPIGSVPQLIAPSFTTPLATLIEQAQHANPSLIALSEQVLAQQSRTQVARYAGKPELTLGVQTIFTDDAINPSIPESGDDPLLLTFSINLPVWRDKYDAQVRESIAQRLALARKREAAHNELSTRLAQAHFDYTDAQRRAELYEITLIPKATESIQSTLASFRTGSSSFTDLLDAQRTLLEFELSAIRSRAAKGRALAQLYELAGITSASVREPHSTIEPTQDHNQNYNQDHTTEDAR